MEALRMGRFFFMGGSQLFCRKLLPNGYIFLPVG